MSVQTFNPTDLSQSAANWAVAQRIVGPFAPHAQVSPDLTIALDPGYLLNGTTLTEVKAQVVGPFAPPTSGFRIDRVVVDRTTGAANVVAGTANSLTPPAIPAGKLPVARVFLDSTKDVIANSGIVDERALFDQTPQTANQVICYAHRNGVNQSLGLSVWAQVQFTNTLFNVGNAFDTTTSQFKPNVPGYYQVNTSIMYTTLSAGAAYYADIQKNGTDFAVNTLTSSLAGQFMASISNIVYMNGTTDYLTVQAYYNYSATSAISGSSLGTWFSACKVG
ncbi:C1q-like domain-containing protein [Azospirillum rugosum]|uniref:C1q domain-containing protein n=1 Tax=Azospirillum rugosum TaxID=416170 RepID=A0ABS4SHA1_9PROT|nr:hypothetical protein [Azospirillum rugosum]MBP2291939.1 hypothetical protein [Azospirillum rugosum]MDQ0525925.1 hypothetical protein [Azospirillum rugosum]